jgi:hypothetical protein
MGLSYSESSRYTHARHLAVNRPLLRVFKFNDERRAHCFDNSRDSDGRRWALPRGAQPLSSSLLNTGNPMQNFCLAASLSTGTVNQREAYHAWLLQEPR